jgi:hypothetical protein
MCSALESFLQFNTNFGPVGNRILKLEDGNDWCNDENCAQILKYLCSKWNLDMWQCHKHSFVKKGWSIHVLCWASLCLWASFRKTFRGITLTQKYLFPLQVLEPLSEELICKCMTSDSHCGGYEEFCLMGHNSVKVNQHFGGTCYSHLQGHRIAKKEIAWSS